MDSSLLNEEWRTPEGFLDAMQLSREPDGRLVLYVGRWEGDSVTLTDDMARKLRDALGTALGL